MTDNELKNICRRVKNIYNCINKIYNEDDGLMIFNSNEYFNQGPSSVCQISDPNIFILESYYGSPHYIHSYLGKHSITGSTGSSNSKSCQRLKEYLNNKLDLRLIENGYQDIMGYHGPWYQIMKCDNEIFNSNELNDRNNCYKNNNILTYQECKSIFNKYII